MLTFVFTWVWLIEPLASVLQNFIKGFIYIYLYYIKKRAVKSREAKWNAEPLTESKRVTIIIIQ